MSDSHFDWQGRYAGDAPTASIVDSRRRMRLLLAGFVLLLAIVMARSIALEVTYGEAVRSEAARTMHRDVPLPPVRGRIVAQDGTVLAEDRSVMQIMVAYRALQTPPDPAWLRRQSGLRRQGGLQRRGGTAGLPSSVERAELDRLHAQLAKLAGVTLEEWNARRRRIEHRVERIARSVNARHLGNVSQRTNAATSIGDTSWLARAGRWLSETFPPPESTARPPIIVAEQVQHHRMATDVSAESVETIRALLERDDFAARVVKLEEATRRVYPLFDTAAHVLGHVGPPIQPDTAQPAWVGRLGVERQFEEQLRGRPGAERQRINHARAVLDSTIVRPAENGQDVRLTLDIALQRSAESLLDSALDRRPDADNETSNGAMSNGGGALIVLDCRTGEVRAAASGPRFDPNIFTRRDSHAISQALDAAGHPMLNRTVQMVIPPGSVMKIITAIALLEEGTVTADQSFHCQGYLHMPDRQRCALYRRHGIGHEDLTLAGALGRSCNVYFFHHAPRMGGRALGTWADRFGLGRTTGVELPSEAAGRLPTPEWTEQRFGRSWRDGDTQLLAIGQGSLTTTPMQIARATAAIANGGFLVRPHIIANDEESETIHHSRGRKPAVSPAVASKNVTPVAPKIIGLRDETLRVVRRGMRQAVSDPEGTVHRYLDFDDLSVAAKTGTAETGGGRADHAWLAGYAPADAPRYVFVIALEHAGNADQAAGPVARRLLRRMQALGYFGDR